MILLENTKVVILVKDLVTLGPKILTAKRSYPDNLNTKNADEAQFLDKTGNPLKIVELKNDDLIGTTMPWSKLGAKNYYPGYDRTFGTFHFAFLKYEKAQQYRNVIPTVTRLQGGVAFDEDIAKMSVSERAKAIPISWFISVLSPESPVKCFK